MQRREPHATARAIAVPRPLTGPSTFVARGLFATTVAGLGVTLRHFFRNLFGRRDTATVRYPEERRQYPPGYRGEHRLMTREDGSLRCVACMLCPTICPAHCITVEAEENPASDEKRARLFEIDELRCVMCGLCVEACPVDAIRMDTGRHVEPVYERADAIFDARRLLRHGERSQTLHSPGVGLDWRERVDTNRDPSLFPPDEDRPRD